MILDLAKRRGFDQRIQSGTYTYPIQNNKGIVFEETLGIVPAFWSRNHDQ